MKIAVIGINQATIAFIESFFSKWIPFDIQIVVIPIGLFSISNYENIDNFKRQLHQFQIQPNLSIKVELASNSFSLETLLSFDEIVFCAIAWSDSVQLPRFFSQCEQVLDLDFVDIDNLSNLAKQDSKILIQSGTEKSIELGLALAAKGHKVFLHNESTNQLLPNIDNNFLDLLCQELEDKGIQFNKFDTNEITNFDLGIWNLTQGSCSFLLDYFNLDYDKAIKVTPNLEALNNNHIWALGIAGETGGVVLGNGSSLQYQASQVVNAILGHSTKNPIGLRISCDSLEVLGFGYFQKDLDTFYYLDSRHCSYKAVQVKDDHLIAGIFLGTEIDRQVLELVQLWQTNSFFRKNPMLAISASRSPLPATSPLNMPASMLVCQCNLVTKSDLVSAAQEVDTFEQLQQLTKASMGCGGCLSLASSIYEWVANTQALN